MEKPSVPELSFKPDFMINLENRLLFVEVATLLREENSDWITLRLIEHLFETKLFCGNKSSFTLVILNKKYWRKYCIELLENFYDKVVFEPTLRGTSEIHAIPKESNYELWDLEREYERSRYRKFAETELRRFEYHKTEESDLENALFDRLLNRDLPVQRNYPVRNLKNYYLSQDMNLRFYFDFYCAGKIVEIKSFKRINDLTLQNLLIKARLIRYEKTDGRIIRAPRRINSMILLINGNLSGPHYDRFRYLRMLTNAGWDVYPSSEVFNDKIEGFLG